MSQPSRRRHNCSLASPPTAAPISSRCAERSPAVTPCSAPSARGSSSIRLVCCLLLSFDASPKLTLVSGLSVNLLLLLALTHTCFPRARTTTRKFFELSYYDAASGQYTQGWEDFHFVTFGIIVFTALRAATMDYVLKPLARMGGIQKKKATVRFAEQGWLLIYCSIFWTLGMVRHFF